MVEEKRIISNKVVLMAMKSLAARVNRSTGISHPSDKKATIDTFKILKKYKEHYDPIEIKSWLILKADWEPKFADDVAKIAKGILEGKSFRSTQKHASYKSNIIDLWREESEDPKRNSEDWKNIF